MHKEKMATKSNSRVIDIEDNKIKGFNKKALTYYSFRVYDGEYAGIEYVQGNISDDEGFKKAERNLSLKRPYKFTPETGTRRRDMTETKYTDKELMDIAREVLEFLKTNYHDYRFNGRVYSEENTRSMQNSLGLDYSNTDSSVLVEIDFKHNDSKHIVDGYFSLDKRTFDMEKLKAMADNYLSAYTNTAELPEELIIQQQYYTYTSVFYEQLDAENIALKTSMLADRIGQKVFADSFTLAHDVTDKNTWFSPFYDGEGVVCENDRFIYIENGVVRTGFADKFTADKYGVQATGSAGQNLADIPHNGGLNLLIDRSDKTAKQLLDGRLTVVPVIASGGGYNDKGEYVTPVQKSMLCDGERLLGSLPEFSYKGSMFDIFGKNFIGVPSDEPVFCDKQILVKMDHSK